MRRAWLGLVVVFGTACGNGNADAVDTVDDVLAPDAAPLPPVVFGGDRPVQLGVPFDVEAGETYPLFLILHGYGVDGFTQQAYLGLGALRSTPGAFVLAPDGTLDDGGNRFWNASGACCDFADNGVDDVAYLGGLIDDVMAAWPVDPTRVFVVGHSNGGFMAHRLACERADVVTGIAELAGAGISTDDAVCMPSAPVNVLHMHGTNDATVAFGGGVLLAGMDPYPDAVTTTGQWADDNGCSVNRDEHASIDIITNVPGFETVPSDYRDCPAGGAVTLWQIDGGQHIPTLTDGFAPALIDWLTSHPRP